VLTSGLDQYAPAPDPPGFFQDFATFLFRQYFLGFPQEREGAARIDGLGYFGTFWRVVVPNSLGFVAAIGSGIKSAGPSFSGKSWHVSAPRGTVGRAGARAG